MIDKIKEVLLDIKQDNNWGLLTGKSGTTLLLYHYSHIYKDKKIEQSADNLLDEIFESLKKQDKFSFSAFDNGLAGIGWYFEYLVEHKFCEGNTDYILEDVDSVVFKTVNEQEQLPLNLQQGLIGYLLYVTSRLKNKDTNKLSVRINRRLMIKIINKLDEMIPNHFPQMGKEIQFDLLWLFPVLFLALDKALELNIYNEKIVTMIEQWMFYLTIHLPGIHCHRLLLALALYKINEKLRKNDIDKQIKMLLYSIDFDMFRKEIDPYSLNLQYGWHGVVLLLYLARRTFNADYPNYEALESLRCEILSLYKEKSEKQIEAMLQLPALRKIVGKGLVNGLAGIGMLYLFYPEALNE